MRTQVATPDIFKAYDIRGLYGEQIDGDLAERIGRAFARVLGGLAGKPVSELRVGPRARHAPERARAGGALPRGPAVEGANVIDAGQVGSEMLYYLVGSRELDGGLMCTASHNPKAYTGAKLVREGAIALSGDTGIQDIRREIEAEDASGAGAPRRRPARGTIEEVDMYEEFQAAALRFIDADAVRSAPRTLKVVVDGGNGMAGPMVGPVLESLDLELIETYWTPDGNFPDHEPNPLLPENRRLIIEQVRESGRRPRHRLGRRRRPLLLHRRHRRVRRRRLPHRAAGRVAAGQGSNPTRPEAILYDVRASRAVARHGRRGRRRRRTSTASATRSSRRACARRARCSAARSPGTTTSATSTARTRARSRRCSCSSCCRTSGKRMSELLAPYHAAYFISGEVNSEVADPQAKMEEIAARYADARQERLDGISIDYEDWHFNVRSSNTEPLLRLCLESLVSPADMERRRDEVLALIRSAAPTGS